MKQKKEIVKDNLERAKKKLPSCWTADVLSSSMIPSDTCSVCTSVYNQAEYEQAMRTNINLCDNCRADVMISRLDH